jgi:hypothetical protein
MCFKVRFILNRIKCIIQMPINCELNRFLVQLLLILEVNRFIKRTIKCQLKSIVIGFCGRASSYWPSETHFISVSMLTYTTKSHP